MYKAFLGWGGVFLFALTLPTLDCVEAKIIESFADIAEKAIPGVVNIRTTSYTEKGSADLDVYKFFLQGRLPNSTTSQSLGSGVMIDRKGFIVTNHHVIKGASSIHVLLANSRKQLLAKVMGSDPKTDLALLYVTPDKTAGSFTALDLGNSDSLRVGDIVLAIGNPFGYAHTVTSGIISAKGRVIGAGPYDNFLQTDAGIHPGNSGGPLLDIRGRVIGINTAVSEKGEGIGFAIPINLVRKIVDDLQKHGKVKRPWLGVVGKNIQPEDDLESNIGVDQNGLFGVIVANLIVEGPAFKAGVKMGDVILSIGDTKISDMNHLQRVLTNLSPHEQIRIKIYRRQAGFMYLTISLEEIPKTEDLPVEKDFF